RDVEVATPDAKLVVGRAAARFSSGHSPVPVRFSNMDRVARGGASEIRDMGRDRLGRGLIMLIALVAVSVPSAGQVGFDRPGGDYASFALRSGDPAQCATRCERDPRCRAWAFSYPATESANAVCWLKSRVVPRIAALCCVSGVRGTGVIEPRGGTVE